MKMDAGMDPGPVYTRKIVDIAEDETPTTLFDKLSTLSAQILMENIFKIAEGKLLPVPQEGEPTSAPPLEKSMGLIDFNQDARLIACKIRGLSGWPTAYTFFNGKRLVIHEASVIDMESEAAPGTILSLSQNKTLLVACKSGTLAIHTLQLEGKKQATVESFFNGYKPLGLVLCNC